MKNKGERGFTLVEVMISMVIFAIGILAIINMQLISTKTNMKSRGITEAIVVAQNKIEELAAIPYGNVLLTDRTTGANVGAFADLGLDDFPANDTAVDNADHTDVTNPFYQVYWNVWDDTPFTDTKTVRVTVRWYEQGIFYNFPMDMVKAYGSE